MSVLPGRKWGATMYPSRSSRKQWAVPPIVLTMLLALPAVARSAGVPLLDDAGGAHGSAKVILARGIVQLKITGLARLPASVSGGSTTFTAHAYKAYLTSTTDPAVEVFLTDVYPTATQRAGRKVSLGGDVTQMGFNRIVVTAFSKDGQSAADVLTGAIAP